MARPLAALAPAISQPLKVEADGLAAEEEARKEADAKAAKEKIDNDPINVAIREHKIVKGMTVEQVDLSLKLPNTKYAGDPKFRSTKTSIENSDGSKTIVWHLYKHIPLSSGGTSVGVPAGQAVGGIPGTPDPTDYEIFRTAIVTFIEDKVVTVTDENHEDEQN